MYWVCLYFTAVNPFEFISASLLNVWITCFYSLPVPFLAPVPCTLQRSQGFDHSCMGRTAVKVMSSCWALKLFSVELESHRPPGEPQVCSVNMANWREKNNTPGLTKEELTVFFLRREWHSNCMYDQQANRHIPSFSPWLEMPLHQFRMFYGAARARGQTRGVLFLCWTAGLYKNLSTDNW